MVVISSIFVILVASVVIYLVGARFAQASSNLGDYLELPRSVKGATFDAISSSFPELMIALFSVLFFGSFDLGVGTIVGSAFFNLLVIPALAVLFSPVLFKVSRDVVFRDGVFYVISVVMLIVALVLSSSWGLLMPIIFLLVYGVYVFFMYKDSVGHIRSKTSKRKETNVPSEIFVAILSMAIIGVASYYLTESAVAISEALNISPVIIAFTVIAAATSVPDTVISVINARKGHATDATSNAIGSNIFNILVGLSLPLILIYLLSGEPTRVVFYPMSMLFGLLFVTVFTLLIFWKNEVFSKRSGALLLFIYLIFLSYVIYLSQI